MFGLDQSIAALGTGQVFALVAAVAVLLGLRHAADPDHLTAVSALVASDGGCEPRRAGALGLSWGLGHATTLFALGLPIVLSHRYLPESAQRVAEGVIGLVIVGLSARLLVRWRRRRLSLPVGAPRRSPLQAYSIGLIHGIGGSAGVGVLLLASIPDHVEGVAALALFATFTAVSMAIASTSFGYALSREAVLRRFTTVTPMLGGAGVAFGIWYALGAAHVLPYFL
jgi:hypothetical protein